MSENNHRNNQHEKTTKWETFEEITGFNYTPAGGGAAARISILKINYPKYSFELGWMMNGLFTRNFRHGYDLADLPEIAVKAKERTAALTAESQELEARDKERHEKQSKDREAKEAAKRLRHQANLNRRREEDRARAHGGGSGGKNKQGQPRA